MLAIPTPDEIRAARTAAGLSQAQAAAMVFYGHLTRWAELERGKHSINLAVWELFLIKTNQHPDRKT